MFRARVRPTQGGQLSTPIVGSSELCRPSTHRSTVRINIQPASREGICLMQRWACRLRLHRWHKVFDHETQKMWLECRRCGRRKIPIADMGSNPNTLMR